MGTAAARSLARAGRSTLLIEQFRIGHARGSSHGRARIFRLSYRDAAYVAMAREAQVLWREMERDAGVALLSTTGGLDVGDGIDANAAALEECGVTYEMLDPAEVRRRFPSVSLPGDAPALFQPDSGVVDAEGAVGAFVSSARSHGAEARERVRVDKIEVGDTAIAVTSEGDKIEADVAVVTAGGWASSLLATAGIDLPVRPTRETVSYFELDGDGIPTFVDWGDPSVYALPSRGQGLKAGEHIAGPTTDPDEEGRVDRDSIERVAAWVAERFPGAARAPHHAETCIYTNTEDESFILQRNGPLVVGSPCSGHGFKFAPLIGERLAALAADA